MKRLKTSWWSRPGRTYKEETLRNRAAQWAEKYCGPNSSDEWRCGFDGFVAGWLQAARAKYAQLRVDLETENVK